jgi:hypothetical protein
VGRRIGSKTDRDDERLLTGCKHGLPYLLASNDRKGERKSLSFGGEKRRPSTGGSAKGIPESEGKRIDDREMMGENDRTSEEF